MHLGAVHVSHALTHFFLSVKISLSESKKAVVKCTKLLATGWPTEQVILTRLIEENIIFLFFYKLCSGRVTCTLSWHRMLRAWPTSVLLCFASMGHSILERRPFSQLLAHFMESGMVKSNVSLF